MWELMLGFGEIPLWLLGSVGVAMAAVVVAGVVTCVVIKYA